MARNKERNQIISVESSPDQIKAKNEQDYQNQINTITGVFFVIAVIFITADLYFNRQKHKNEEIRETSNNLARWSYQLNQRFVHLIESVFELVGVNIIENGNIFISEIEYVMIKARSRTHKDKSIPADYYLIAIPKTFFNKFNTRNENTLLLSITDVQTMKEAIDIIKSSSEKVVPFIDHSKNERYLIGLYSSKESKRNLIYIFPELDDRTQARNNTIRVEVIDGDIIALPQAILLEAGDNLEV